MALQPTKNQIKPLSSIEKFGYRCADFINRRLKSPFVLWNITFMNFIIAICLMRRLKIHGIEHLLKQKRSDRIVFAANHRSFFDFFIVTWITYNKTKLSKRIFFPVRSTFFYDSLIGLPFNMIMGGFAMFPPIFRDENKKPFNQFAMDRLVDELKNKGAIVGFHPEGRRNKGNDPYAFLPAKPGVGRVILGCESSIAIPIFITGVSNKVISELWKNIWSAKKHPIDVHIGEAIDFKDLRKVERNRETQLKASQRCMSAIVRLSVQHKNHFASGK